MTRRRFFPQRPAQGVPGQTLALETLLRPEAAPQRAAAACSCDTLGVALVADYLPDAYGVPGEPPGYVWVSNYVYAPRLAGWRVTGGYVSVPNTYEAPLQLRAVLIGATLCAVEWHWTLDVPPIPGGGYGGPGGAYEASWWGGLEVEPQGNALGLTVLQGGFYGGDTWWAELRATASCAGQPVGELVLRPGTGLSSTPGVLPPIA